MDNLTAYLSYYKQNIFLGVGYLAILISIPLSFSLVKDAQVFRSRASEVKPTPAPITQKVTGLQNIPAASPLDELKKATEIPTPIPNNSTPTSSSNINFGPSLKFKVILEGRGTNDNSAKIFIGLAAGQPSVKPTHLLTFTIDIPASGMFTGLSLAGLTAGSTYTAYLKGPGQIDVASTFTMLAGESSLNSNDPLILPSGDLNEDNTVNDADLTLINKLYGTTPSSANWNSKADFNGDKVINSWDIAFVNKNLGKVGASGIWYSTPPSTSTSGGQGGMVTLPDPIGPGRWVWVP